LASVRSKSRAAIAAGVIAALLAAAAASPALAHGRHVAAKRHAATERHAAAKRHADAERHYLRGIDVSHYQGAIDWPAVARDDVAFAYVKATEGEDGRDARFERNWRGAEHAGVRVGAYHYFIFCRSGRAQAANFLATAPRSGALPPAVDLEPPRSCHGRLSGSELHRELADYLAVVEAREHRRAVLYVTPRFYRAYHAWLPSRPMWRRSIAERPTPEWTFWQYRSRGRVAGIRTYVDLNMCDGHGRALAL
jgi:lysozyme